MSSYSKSEKSLDLILGISFLLISIFSLLRLLTSMKKISSNRKVIVVFNILIFLTAITRTIWFLIPNNTIEVSYIPIVAIAYETYGWCGCLISELLLVSGNLCLYGIFILIICCWMHILGKLGNHNNRINEIELWNHYQPKKLDTLGTFQMITMIFVLYHIIVVGLYLTKIINSEQMILSDSIIFSIISLLIIIFITILSNEINSVLSNLDIINNKNSQPQIKRIIAIVFVGNIFFLIRVVLECTLAICLIVLMIEQHSFTVLLSDKYWFWYIALKHISEIVVLILELMISSVITSYEINNSNSNILPIVNHNVNESTHVSIEKSLELSNLSYNSRENMNSNRNIASFIPNNPYINLNYHHNGIISYHNYGSTSNTIEAEQLQNISIHCSSTNNNIIITELTPMLQDK